MYLSPQREALAADGGVCIQQSDLATASKYVGHGNPALTARIYSYAIGSLAEQAARVAEAMKRADFGH